MVMRLQINYLKYTKRNPYLKQNTRAYVILMFLYLHLYLSDILRIGGFFGRLRYYSSVLSLWFITSDYQVLTEVCSFLTFVAVFCCWISHIYTNIENNFRSFYLQILIVIVENCILCKGDIINVILIF